MEHILRKFTGAGEDAKTMSALNIELSVPPVPQEVVDAEVSSKRLLERKKAQQDPKKRLIMETIAEAPRDAADETPDSYDAIQNGQQSPWPQRQAQQQRMANAPPPGFPGMEGARDGRDLGALGSRHSRTSETELQAPERCGHCGRYHTTGDCPAFKQCKTTC